VDRLAAEMADLDARLAGLGEGEWARITPFKGWTVFDHVHHLNLSDDLAASALQDPEAFRQARRDPGPPPPDGRGYGGSPDIPPREMLERWRRGGRALLEGFRAADPARRLPWFGPDMAPATFINARLMETWAHGQTIHDALGLDRAPTDRIRPICDLGWRTMGWSFRVHGRPHPAERVSLRLESPGGETWTWGPEPAGQLIEGPAADFALVVCQCRNIADVDLKVTGETARDWMAIAQCFAGQAVTPPAPGVRLGRAAERDR
jgi:uncharacterized protein (TIGR03084 family)